MISAYQSAEIYDAVRLLSLPVKAPAPLYTRDQRMVRCEASDLAPVVEHLRMVVAAEASSMVASNPLT